MRKNQDLGDGGNYHDHRDHIDVGDADYGNNLIRPHALDKESELDPRRGGETDRVVQDRTMTLHVLLRLTSYLGHNSVGTLFAFLGIQIFPISKYSQLYFHETV